MALGKQNDNYTQGNLLILRPITQDVNKQAIPATFQVEKKVDGDYVVQDETVSSVTGDLFRLETYVNDWVDDKTKKKMVSKGFKVFMKDEEANEAYIVDCRLNNLTRGLLNKLLGLDTTKNVTLSVFRGKTGFNNSSVKVGEERVSWKFDPKTELPEPILIKHPVTDEILSRDPSKLDEFLLNAANEFALSHGLVKGQKVEKMVEEVEEDGVLVSSEEDDDEPPY